MSNNWKKRVSDFFFEEIEVEMEEEAVNQSDHPVYRTHPTPENVVKTKVAYQYSKNNETAFRFPIIPDDKKETVADYISSIRKRNRKTKRHSNHNYGQVRKPLGKELEDVPAYVRRQREREMKYGENPPVEASINEDKSEQTEVEKIDPLEGYSRPDELDRIFRIRDGNFRENEQDSEMTKKTARRNEFLSDQTARRKRIARLRQQTQLEKEDVPEYRESTRSPEDNSPIKPVLNVYNETYQEQINYNNEAEAAHGFELEKQSTYDSELAPGFELERESTSGSDHAPGFEPEKQLASDSEFAPGFEPERELALEPGIEMGFNQNSEAEVRSLDDDPVYPVVSSVPNYLLDDPKAPLDGGDEWLTEQQYLLNQTLEHFKIDAKVVKVTQGPSVTRFEIQPALGVKVSRIRGLSDDIKLNMAATDIRMEAPIPGKNTIGIEVPNQYPQVVGLQEIIESDAFEQSASDLTIALGLTIEGEPLITTIDKMPHGLIAGATGSGKSVCINSIILSVLYKASHEDVKFMMIDPKMVELTPYNGIPHLISPVITDAKAATIALKWAVDEMESRYGKLAEAGVRNIQRYNEKMLKEERITEKMPYIVIVIDELADLMIVSPQEVEDAVCRIAQKARACGMHLLLATQRPSVDVITGLIKANIPTRIAFSVSSQVDSRTILDTGGAEKLLGKGDMLFIENGSSKSIRLQGPFVSDNEIDRVASFSRQVAEPNYLFEQDQLLLEVENEDEDELLQEVIAFVVEQRRASTSLLQRRFRIGYNRAARLIDTLEQKGIISVANGSKPRDILVTQAQIEEAYE